MANSVNTEVSEMKTESGEIKDLSHHLIDVVNVVSGWEIVKGIGHGANGVVLVAKKGKVKAVMKVALKASSSPSLVWEAAVMAHIQNPKWVEDRTRHVVRMLDHGRTTNHLNEEVSFVVMEMLPGNPEFLIQANNIKPEERMDKVCEFGLQLLKAVYDLHAVGLLHRDLKPENGKTVVLYDMGMARLFTDAEGKLRVPRSYVGSRGTDEWASLHSEQGRDQGRVDDLWGWFYCMVEWANCDCNQPLAWAEFLMKSSLFPAMVVIANCPTHFYSIQLYLRSLTNDVTPDYFYLASLLAEARHSARRRRPFVLHPAEKAKKNKFLEGQWY